VRVVTLVVGLALTIWVAPLAAETQQTSKAYRIGHLSSLGAPDDPVMAVLISSLSRPGANVTGLSSMNAELDPKRLALLKEALPRLKQVGVLWSPVDPSGSDVVRATETAARSLGVQLQVLEVRGPQDLDEVFATAKKRGAGDGHWIADPLRVPASNCRAGSTSSAI
jgi:putative ABC transport system substrate-binding protein